MEKFFGADLSDVRVHVGREATSIGALAFTAGSNIYFAPGRYQPLSPAGQALLGHELTHVMQQREGRVANPLGNDVAVVQDEALEREADQVGALAARAQPKMAGSSSEYRLILGAYMHQEKLPEQLAGHSFVAIEGPRGQRQAFGFSPRGFSGMDPRRDLGKLQSGVPGVVHDDANAFAKEGVKTRSFPISATQARAAMSKVAEYQSGRYGFSLRDRQCSAFALEVARAAKVPVSVGTPRRPADLYQKL